MIRTPKYGTVIFGNSHIRLQWYTWLGYCVRNASQPSPKQVMKHTEPSPFRSAFTYLFVPMYPSIHPSIHPGIHRSSFLCYFCRLSAISLSLYVHLSLSLCIGHPISSCPIALSVVYLSVYLSICYTCQEGRVWYSYPKP